MHSTILPAAPKLAAEDSEERAVYLLRRSPTLFNASAESADNLKERYPSVQHRTPGFNVHGCKDEQRS